MVKLDFEKKSLHKIAKNVDAETVTGKVKRRIRRASTIRRIDVKIAVERGIVGGRTRGSGVVKGTARGGNRDRHRSPDHRSLLIASLTRSTMTAAVVIVRAISLLFIYLSF